MKKKWPENRYNCATYFVKPGDRLLDIGCGDGSVLNSLKEQFGELYGLELSEKRIKNCHQLLNGTNYSISIENIEQKTSFENNFFDYIISTDVIEHIIDIFSAFREIYRILKPGGTCLSVTPNIAEIRRRFTLLRGKFPSTSAFNEGFDLQDNTGLFDGGHVHYFTYSMLTRLYKKFGFKNIKRHGIGRFGRLHNIYPSLLSSTCVITGEK